MKKKIGLLQEQPGSSKIMVANWPYFIFLTLNHHHFLKPMTFYEIFENLKAWNTLFMGLNNIVIKYTITLK